MARRPSALLAVTLLAVPAISSAQAPGLELRLSPQEQTVPYGSEPRFAVTARNHGSTPLVLAIPVEGLPVTHEYEVERLDGLPARAYSPPAVGLCGNLVPVEPGMFVTVPPDSEAPFPVERGWPPEASPCWLEPGTYRVRLRLEAREDDDLVREGTGGHEPLVALWRQVPRGVVRSPWVQVTVEPPEPGLALRLARFGQVRRGMHLADLRTLLGDPHEDAPPDTPSEDDPLWGRKYERTLSYALAVRPGGSREVPDDWGLPILEVRLDEQERVALVVRWPRTYPRRELAPAATLPEGLSYAVAAHPTRDLVAAGGADGVGLWRSGELAGEVARPPFLLPGKDVFALAFSPDGRWLLVSGAEGLGVWDVAAALAGRASGSVQEGLPRARRLTFCTSGVLFVGSLSDDEPVALCRLEPDRGTLSPCDRPFAGRAGRAARTPDGRLALIGLAPRVRGDGPTNLELWRSDGRGSLRPAGRLSQRPWGPAEDVTAMASSPDGRWFLAGSLGGVGVWSVGGDEAQPTLTLVDVLYVPGEVMDLTFTPDGRHAVVAGAGGVKLWRLDLSGGRAEEVATLPGVHFDVTVSADGRLLLAGTSMRRERAKVVRLR